MQILHTQEVAAVGMAGLIAVIVRLTLPTCHDRTFSQTTTKHRNVGVWSVPAPCLHLNRSLSCRQFSVHVTAAHDSSLSVVVEGMSAASTLADLLCRMALSSSVRCRCVDSASTQIHI
eukprot:EC793733.1.p1 GENE.EC793733.1~~EC793733.1.p1  ORF type:complete len:118 (+),score=5.60 EC793733.1:113-466(+)